MAVPGFMCRRPLVPAETSRAYEGVSLQFRVRDLVDVAERLRDHVELGEPEERPWGSKYLRLKDPTGVQVVLYEGQL